MATLEDAAEELVVRLKGLDSEIEESERSLQELRDRVDATRGEIVEEWSHLADAVGSFATRLQDGQEVLGAAVQAGRQAVADASGTIQDHGTRSRSSIASGESQLQALSDHAAGLEPLLESELSQAGEAPAQGLASRAKAIQQELALTLESASDFMEREVLSAIEELADEVRARSKSVRIAIAEQGAAALQAVFEAWESELDGLEDHVARQGFAASHGHAREVVDWSMEECETACARSLDAAREIVEQTATSLRDLEVAVQRALASLLADAAVLLDGLGSTRGSAARASSALDAVTRLLGSYTFVEA